MTWAAILALCIVGLIQNYRIKRLEKELLGHMERANSFNRSLLDSIRILREGALTRRAEHPKAPTPTAFDSWKEKQQ